MTLLPAESNNSKYSPPALPSIRIDPGISLTCFSFVLFLKYLKRPAKGIQIMLATDKISSAFKAICEEAEKLKKEDVSESVMSGLSTIISIAKHQNDIRNAAKGSCKAHSE
jgi:hypothetical protein